MIAAAGSGERLGAGGPKAFVPLAGRRMVEWSIAACRAAGSVRSIVVACPPGRAGAHQLINRSDRVARFLILSSKALADVIEYPDSGKISAQGGEWGTPEAIAYMLATEPELGYFEGEPD